MVCCEIIVEYNDAFHTLEFDTDDGFEVLQFQLFSLTMVPPENQKLLDSSGVTLNTEPDIVARLTSSSTSPLTIKLIEEVEKGTSVEILEEITKADEALARLLQAEEEVFFLQSQSGQQGKTEFALRLKDFVSQVLQYEDPVLQQKARETVKLTELEEKAVIALAKEGRTSPTNEEIEHYLLFQLLLWFKKSFRWVNAAPCSHCGGDTTVDGMGKPTHEELRYGGNRVELYRCKGCYKITRFPRYNDPLKLLETRRGRCGEWANCFTLYCRAFGYQTRLVFDFTDHLWTECYSNHLGRWIHLDPCEGAFDKPLLYEKGWGKQLNYLIAFSKDGVYDVTKRYTRKWDEVLRRRMITTEKNVADVISSMTEDLRKGFSQDFVQKLRAIDEKEALELREFQMQSGAQSGPLPGRLTGTEDWRKARGEFGNGPRADSNVCPERQFIDQHVVKVFTAIGKLQSLGREGSQHILSVMKDLLNAFNILKEIPYRSRKSVCFPSIAGIDTHVMKFFYDALSLKWETKPGSTDILVSSIDDIATALALPVLLENLNSMADLLENNSEVNAALNRVEFLSTHERLSGAWTQATGEEPPLGIATSAFDGLPSTKWEEPNGAKGARIVHYLNNEQKAEVVLYELVSANDCPERDPYNWMLEGSSDGGHTWTEVDTRISEMFTQRYQSRFFEIQPKKILSCNALRLRFLAVRDSTSQSRLQISCINFYKKM